MRDGQGTLFAQALMIVPKQPYWARQRARLTVEAAASPRNSASCQAVADVQLPQRPDVPFPAWRMTMPSDDGDMP